MSHQRLIDSSRSKKEIFDILVSEHAPCRGELRVCPCKVLVYSGDNIKKEGKTKAAGVEIRRW